MAYPDVSELSQWLALFGQNAAMGFVVVALLAAILEPLESKSRPIGRIAIGVLFGCAGLISMLNPVHVSPGVSLDMRNLFTVVAGLCGGPIGAAIAAAIVGAFRIYQDGPSLVAGLGGIVFAGVIGGFFGRRYGDRVREFGLGQFAAIGLLDAVVTIAWIALSFSILGIPRLGFAAYLSMLLTFPSLVALLGAAMGMTRHRIWRRNEGRLFDILDTSTDLIWESDENGRLTFVSDRHLDVIGFTPEEMLGMPEEQFHGEWIDEATKGAHDAAVAARRRFDGLLVAGRTKDGERKILSVTGRPRFDARGRFVGYRGSSADVTEREQWRGLVGKISSRVANVIGDEFLKALIEVLAEALDAEYVFVGQFDHARGTVSGLRLFRDGTFAAGVELPFEELPSREVASGKPLIIAEGFRSLYPFLVQFTGIAAEAYAGMPLLSARGDVIGVLSALSLRRWQSREAVEAILRLFAGRAAAEVERVAIEAEAESSRRRMAEVLGALDVARDAIFLSDRQGRIVYSNQSAAEALGMAGGPAELVGRRLSDLQPFGPADGQDQATVVGDAGEWRGIGSWVRPIDGRTVHFEARTRALPNGSLVTVATDITERVRREAELQKSLERFEAAQRIGKIASAELDMATGETYWSDEVFRLLGLEPGAIEPTIANFAAYIHPDDKSETLALSAEMTAQRNEYRIIRADGEVRWIYREVEMVRGKDGTPLRLVGMLLDITDRKRLEQALRNGLDRLAMAQRVGQIGSVEVDMTTGTSVWSDEFYRILGIERGEVATGFDSFLAFVHPDDRHIPRRLREEIQPGLSSGPVEFRIVRPDGAVRWVSRQSQMFGDGKGGLTRLVATMQDITERRDMADDLRRGRDRLARAQIIAGMGSIEVALPTGESVWSDAIYKLYGLVPGKASPSFETFIERIHPEDRGKFVPIQSPAGVELLNGPREFRVIRPDGTLVWISRQAELVNDEAGNPVIVVITNQDITERKRMEEALRDSRDSLVMAQRIGRIGSAAIDLRTGQTVRTDEQYRIYGIAREEEEVEVGRFLAMVHPDDRARVEEVRARNVHGLATEPLDFRIVRADGEVRWIHREVAHFRDAAGVPTKLITTQQDITEWRNIENELRRSRDMLARAQRLGKIGSAEVDLRTGSITWSEEQYRMFGLESSTSRAGYEQFLSMVHPDDLDAVRGARERNAAGEATPPVEYRAVLPDGSVRWMRREVEVEHDADGNPIRFLTTQQDVTERHELEDALRRNHERLVRAQRTGRLGSIEIDAATRDEFWSDQFLELCGLDRQTAAHNFSSLIALVHPEDQEALRTAVRETWSGDTSTPLDFRIVRPDGTLRWLQREAEVLRGEDGALQAVVATFKDITDRKRLEIELAAREANLERLARHLDAAQRVGKMGSIDYDPAVGHSVWSEEAYRLLGFDPAEGRPPREKFLSIVHPDDHAWLNAQRALERAGIQTEPGEYRVLRPNGEMLWIYRQAELTMGPEGELQRIVITMQDVTEREKWRRLIETLTTSVGNLIGEDFLKSLVAKVAEAVGADTVLIGRFDLANGRVHTEYVYSNGAFVENFAYSFKGAPSEKIARGETIIIPSRIGDHYPRFVNPFGEGYEAFAGTPLVAAKGEILGLLVAGSRRTWESPDYVGAVIGLFARRAAAEIERIRSERQVEESRSRMHQVMIALDAASEAVIMADEDFRIVYTNEAAIGLFGFETVVDRLIGSRLQSFQQNDDYPERADAVNALIATTGEWRGSLPWVRPSDGRRLLFDAHVRRLEGGGYVGFARDAAPRLKLEEERRQQQMREAQASKLEALGNLAGGIAHDFNNLLQAILGFGQFLVSDLDEDSDQRRYAERIVSASQRGRSLVQQILAFSRRSTVEPTAIRIADSIAEAYELLRATIPASTEIEIIDHAAGATVLGDKAQIMQVLVNLCVNASDALGGRQGKITLTLDRLDRTRADLAQLPPVHGRPAPAGVVTSTGPGGVGFIIAGGLPDGECLSISIQDGGPGIPEAIRSQIFDPFFTTKVKGRGTGIGLAVVHRIVTEYGGAILVKTGEGIGTRFELLLPVVDWEDATAKGAGRPAGLSSDAGRHASILVVDDDEALCVMIGTVLTRHGYRVRSTSDPRVALQWAEEGVDSWDVLVTDQSMPHIRGQDLMRQIMDHLPGIQCILCTGFSSGMDERRAKKLGASGFLQKPFDIDQLIGMVERLIRKKGASRSAIRPSRVDTANPLGKPH